MYLVVILGLLTLNQVVHSEVLLQVRQRVIQILVWMILWVHLVGIHESTLVEDFNRVFHHFTDLLLRAGNPCINHLVLQVMQLLDVCCP